MSRRIAAALAAGVLATTVGYGIDVASGDDRVVAGPGVVTVEIDIENSRFDVERVDVRAGTLVRFVVRNQDPIPHELIVGGDDVHARHARGTERVHPPVPGEVSLLPNDTGVTVYRFDEAGTFDFACHLPRHLEYGMLGEIVVR